MIEKTAIVQNAEIHITAYIGHGCLIGTPAEKVGVFPSVPYGVIVESGAVLHGNITIDAGTWRETRICKGAWLMKSVHCGHDVLVGENVFIAPHASIGGHVEIGEGANIGMGSMIHPKQKLPPYCMIGMGAIVTKTANIKPFEVWAGNPAKFIKMNDIGIEKAGLSKEDVERITDEWNDNL